MYAQQSNYLCTCIILTGINNRSCIDSCCWCIHGIWLQSQYPPVLPRDVLTPSPTPDHTSDHLWVMWHVMWPIMRLHPPPLPLPLLPLGRHESICILPTFHIFSDYHVRYFPLLFLWQCKNTRCSQTSSLLSVLKSAYTLILTNLNCCLIHLKWDFLVRLLLHRYITLASV